MAGSGLVEAGRAGLTADAYLGGGWFAVFVRELPDVFTQTRTLEEVPAAVAREAARVTGWPAECFKVAVRDQT
jgi:hypothetical protein